MYIHIYISTLVYIHVIFQIPLRKPSESAETTNSRSTTANRAQTSTYQSPEFQTVDCIMSEWSNWSECSVSCGTGYSNRSRYVITEPRNGGQPCPKRKVKVRSCVMADC
uniref:Spondin-1 n=1 Tax=Bactrocera dorsalis TaxID=27457 RepID=A0A034V8Q7_BACDO